jgi:hypothetical protein
VVEGGWKLLWLVASCVTQYVPGFHGCQEASLFSTHELHQALLCCRVDDRIPRASFALPLQVLAALAACNCLPRGLPSTMFLPQQPAAAQAQATASLDTYTTMPDVRLQDLAALGAVVSRTGTSTSSSAPSMQAAGTQAGTAPGSVLPGTLQECSQASCPAAARDSQHATEGDTQHAAHEQAGPSEAQPVQHLWQGASGGMDWEQELFDSSSDDGDGAANTPDGRGWQELAAEDDAGYGISAASDSCTCCLAGSEQPGDLKQHKHRTGAGRGAGTIVAVSCGSLSKACQVIHYQQLLCCQYGSTASSSRPCCCVRCKQCLQAANNSLQLFKQKLQSRLDLSLQGWTSRQMLYDV